MKLTYKKDNSSIGTMFNSYNIFDEYGVLVAMFGNATSSNEEKILSFSKEYGSKYIVLEKEANIVNIVNIVKEVLF